MGDQRREVDAAGLGQSDRPGQVGLGHPAADAGATAPCAARRRPGSGAVVVGDADKDDLTAGSDGGDRHRRSRRRHRRPRRQRRPARHADRRRAQVVDACADDEPMRRTHRPSGRDAMGEPVGGDDDRCAAQAQELDQEETRAVRSHRRRPGRRPRPAPGRAHGARHRAARAGRPRRRRSRPARDGAGAPGHGMTERSAPSVVPKPANRVAMQMFGRPRRHGSQRPHGSAGSAATRSPARGPSSDDATELVAEHERTRPGPRRRSRPRDTNAGPSRTGRPP